MKKNKFKIIILLSFLAFAIFVYVLAKLTYYAKTDEITVPLPEEKIILSNKNTLMQEKAKLDNFSPLLTIPSLGINTKIQSVGITRKGNMSTPNNYVDVGLYKYGPLPGEKGSAVIAGHVDNGLGTRAVFGNLKNIKEGDKIYVEMEKGVKTRFTVVSISTYDFDAHTDEVFNQNDNTYLKLITCGGKWIPELRTHDKRIVVTAIKSDT